MSSLDIGKEGGSIRGKGRNGLRANVRMANRQCIQTHKLHGRAKVDGAPVIVYNKRKERICAEMDKADG